MAWKIVNYFKHIKAPKHIIPANSPHKWPVTREMFPFDDVIMVKESPANLIFNFTMLTSVSELFIQWYNGMKIFAVLFCIIICIQTPTAIFPVDINDNILWIENGLFTLLHLFQCDLVSPYGVRDILSTLFQSWLMVDGTLGNKLQWTMRSITQIYLSIHRLVTETIYQKISRDIANSVITKILAS